MRKGMRGAYGYWLWIGCLTVAATQAQATARLQLPPVPTATSPVTVMLPESTVAGSQWLLELDATDVSPLLDRSSPGQLHFKPPSPLTTGDHQLRLVEVTTDGELREHGLWTFTVRHSERFRDASLHARLDVGGRQRLDDQHLPSPTPSRFQADGGLRLGATAANSDWHSSAVVEALGTSRDPFDEQERDGLALGYVRLDGGKGPWQWTLGDQIPGQPGLLVEPTLRRGVAAGFATDPLDLTLWSVRTPLAGGGSALWTGNEERRTDGVTLTHRVFADHPERLTLSASWLQGEGARGDGDPGSGMTADPDAAAGQAGSVALQSWLFQRRLHWQGEYAWSHRDGEETGEQKLDDEDDSAYATQLTWYPLRQLKLANRPLALNLGLERREVGPHFYSPLNPQQLTDHNLLGGFAGLHWAGVSLQAYGGHQDDNVDDNPLLADTELRQQSYSLGFAPSLATPWPLLGQPSLSLSWQDNDQRVTRSAALLDEGPLYRNRQLTGSAAFYCPAWSWDLSHSRGRDRAWQDLPVDLHTELSQLALRLPLGQRLTLEPYGQYSRVMNRLQASDDSTLRQAGLTLGMQWHPRFWSSLTYTYGKRNPRRESAQRLDDVQGSVQWQWRRPRGWVPGFNLSLGGQYFRQPLLLTASESRTGQWQVFAGITASWATTPQQGPQ